MDQTIYNYTKSFSLSLSSRGIYQSSKSSQSILIRFDLIVLVAIIMELDTRSMRMINYDHRDRASTRLVSHDHFLTDARTLHLRLKYEPDFLSLSLSFSSRGYCYHGWMNLSARGNSRVRGASTNDARAACASVARTCAQILYFIDKIRSKRARNVIVWNIKSFIAVRNYFSILSFPHINFFMIRQKCLSS